MAQRFSPLSTTLPPPARPRNRRWTIPSGSSARLQSRFERERHRFASDPRLYLWQLGWSPIWLGANGPAPRPGQRASDGGLAGLPRHTGQGRHMGLPLREIEADSYVRANLWRLGGRFWLALLAGSILRGLWIALVIATAWALLAVAGIGAGPPILVIAVLAGAGAAIGAIYALLHPIDAATVATMLDRTFGLEERLTTANDDQALTAAGPASSGGSPGLARLQHADAANTLGEVLRELPRSVFIPVRELIALLVVTLALLTALFAHVPDRALPGLAEAPVPRFVPASERLANPQAADRPPEVAPEAAAPSVAEVQQDAQAAQQAREDLGVLGEAFEDHPLTQSAADAIAAGDYAGASEAIRSAAEQAPNASEDERGALADDLDEAADAIAPTNPDLADSSREAADDLREGGPEAGQGLDGLATTVDETAGAVAPEDQGSQQEQQSGAPEQGNPGLAEPGETGGSGSTGQGQQGSAPDGSSQSGQSAAEPGESGAGDPGEGIAAQPGVANQGMEEPGTGGEAGETSGGASAGQTQSGAGGAPEQGAPGASGSESAGQEQPAASGASTEGGPPSSLSDSQGLQGAPDDETSASQGSGAGTGQAGAADQPRGDQEVGDPAAPGEGEPADPPPPGEVADGPTGIGGGTGSAGEIGQGGASNNLSLEGTSDEGVRTGGTSGSSSVGSGSGSGAASGDQVQQQVGVAGPDANRIPDGMQDVVEDFFTEPGAGR